jgi:hypothetical protein
MGFFELLHCFIAQKHGGSDKKVIHILPSAKDCFIVYEATTMAYCG